MFNKQQLQVFLIMLAAYLLGIIHPYLRDSYGTATAQLTSIGFGILTVAMSEIFKNKKTKK